MASLINIGELNVKKKYKRVTTRRKDFFGNKVTETRWIEDKPGCLATVGGILILLVILGFCSSN